MMEDVPEAAVIETNQSPNQCDGCQAGIPIEVNQYGTPLHRMGFEGKYPDYMACTAKLYDEKYKQDPEEPGMNF